VGLGRMDHWLAMYIEGIDTPLNSCETPAFPFSSGRPILHAMPSYTVVESTGLKLFENGRRDMQSCSEVLDADIIKCKPRQAAPQQV
jgi:hypothetical protein